MQLFVRTSSRVITLDVSQETSIQHIKELVELREGIPVSEQRLRFSSTSLTQNSRTVNDYSIPNNACISLGLPVVGGVQILVKNIGKPAFPMEVELTDTIEHLKQKIQQSQGIAPQEFKLTFRGKLLQNELELKNISDLVSKGKATVMMTKTQSSQTSQTAVEEEPATPVPCVGNCGFYGSSKTEGYCSLCYKNLRPAEVVPSVTVTPTPAVTEPAVESNQPLEDRPKQINPSRCYKCNKKVGHLGFQCKCEYIFCGKHRYHNEHDCTVDYHHSAKDQLRQVNLPVIAAKMDKI